MHRPSSVERKVKSMVNTVASAETVTLPRLLKRLEVEAIEIMREVVAEFKNPVMLYSIGKDSSVMLHLAIKAFHPAYRHHLEVPRDDRVQG
jgi:3'-phosphoadenosine 5'-phosphosulfate sulfotransferase (PAPS reductase)/FAD synthetase